MLALGDIDSVVLEFNLSPSTHSAAKNVLNHALLMLIKKTTTDAAHEFVIKFCKNVLDLSMRNSYWMLSLPSTALALFSLTLHATQEFPRLSELLQSKRSSSGLVIWRICVYFTQVFSCY